VKNFDKEWLYIDFIIKSFGFKIMGYTQCHSKLFLKKSNREIFV